MSFNLTSLTRQNLLASCGFIQISGDNLRKKKEVKEGAQVHPPRGYQPPELPPKSPGTPAFTSKEGLGGSFFLRAVFFQNAGIRDKKIQAGCLETEDYK